MKRTSQIFRVMESDSIEFKMSIKAISEFMSVYPEVVSELTAAAEKYKSKEAAEWYKKSLEYNLSIASGKNGLMVVLVYKNCIQDVQLTEENLRLAHLLGWCLELLHLTIIITDDIIDNSYKRRGKLCWFRVDDVGMNAVNDALLTENGVFIILKKYFRHLDCYMELVELFHENIFKCMCGQNMDMILTENHISTFNMESYNSLVMNKGASHSFYLPIHLGLRLAGVKDKEILDECDNIIYDLGQYHQIQNDFLDCFGTTAVTGKIGNDIQSNKYTWLAVMCMQLADPEQKTIMEECYGKNDPQKIAQVKKLYEELNLPSIYSKYEEETLKKIKGRIQQATYGIPREALLEILNQIQKVEIK